MVDFGAEGEGGGFEVGGEGEDEVEETALEGFSWGLGKEGVDGVESVGIRGGGLRRLSLWGRPCRRSICACLTLRRVGF